MKTLLANAQIYTAWDKKPWAEALLIDGKEITAVGTNAEIAPMAAADTTQIDLQGAFVAPGFVDAHAHMFSLASSLEKVDLREANSLKACMAHIAQAAATTRPGQWIVGRGWNHNRWPEKREPDRHDLDAVAPNNPCCMTRVCGHAICVNSLAMELAGIHAGSPEPPGGRIERESDGKTPSGLIRESVELVEQVIPPFGPEDQKRLLQKAQECFLAQGITWVYSFEGLEMLKVFHAIEQEGNLKLRVYHSLPPEELEAYQTWQRQAPQISEMLLTGHTKIFADGSLGAGSAWLHEPSNHGDCGIACLSPTQLQAQIESSYRMGYSVIIHAIGDRATTEAINAIERARKRFPGAWRDRLEHLQLCRTEDFARMKTLDIAACVQPLFLQTDRDVALASWGEERCQRAYAWRCMENAGLRLLFSSDAPIESFNPLAGIETAVTRKSFAEPTRPAWHPEQCLGVESALKAYFQHAGWVAGQKTLARIIMPGMAADLTVLDKNPLLVPTDEIRTIAVRMTLVNGEIVFKKEGFVA